MRFKAWENLAVDEEKNINFTIWKHQRDVPLSDYSEKLSMDNVILENVIKATVIMSSVIMENLIMRSVIIIKKIIYY